MIRVSAKKFLMTRPVFVIAFKTPVLSSPVFIPYKMFAAKPSNTVEAAKAAAKQFMEAVKEESHIEEIANYNEWKTKVMDELNTPIILDCYADWCQPCKKLTPILENLT
jgi:thiol-disulfide isomerase/thioredoxin